MRSLVKIVSSLVLVPFVVATFVFNVSNSFGQTQTGAARPYAMKFFLDAPPTRDDLANLPSEARGVVIAKVHISQLDWLGPQETLGGIPFPPPGKHLLSAQVQVVDVLSGAAKTGDQLDVYIATKSAAASSYIRPATPAMKERNYFIVTFLNAENENQLLGLPASREEFDKWQSELWKQSH